MKAAEAWAHADLRTACRILASKPLWAWWLPWNVGLYRYLRHVAGESAQLLVRTGWLRNGKPDGWGNTFWVDDRGRLVKYRLGERNRT